MEGEPSSIPLGSGQVQAPPFCNAVIAGAPRSARHQHHRRHPIRELAEKLDVRAGTF
jgi:hypothetical protein